MIKNVKFEDLVPGFTFYVGYGQTISGSNINRADELTVVSLPYNEKFRYTEAWAWWVDCKSPYDPDRIVKRSLQDMNIIMPNHDRSRYNNHFSFYTYEEALAYTRDPSILIGSLEAVYRETSRNLEQKLEDTFVGLKVPTKEEIEKVRAFFESEWGTFTNDAGWVAYDRLSHMNDGQMFNSLKSVLNESVGLVFDSMTKKVEGQ